MPPDGYETVTLPADLVQEIDNTELGDSRTSVVRSLIAYYREGETSDSGQPAEPSVDTDALNELLGAARTIEERTNNIEKRLDDMGSRR